MARKYDRLVKYYASWFDDLRDKEKGFSYEEIGRILCAIADTQIHGDFSYMDALPIEIRRGLQMATLKEQTQRIIERAENIKQRGRSGASTRWNGGQTTQEQMAEREAEARKAREREENIRKERQNERDRHELEKAKSHHLKNLRFFLQAARSAGMSGPEWVAKKACDENYLHELQSIDIEHGKIGGGDFFMWRKVRELALDREGYSTLFKEMTQLESLMRNGGLRKQ